jgi:hypothetical protein
MLEDNVHGIQQIQVENSIPEEFIISFDVGIKHMSYCTVRRNRTSSSRIPPISSFAMSPRHQDVGGTIQKSACIRTSSSCIFSKDVQEEMIDWQIMNLLPTKISIPITYCHTCHRKSSYFHPIQSEISYCKTHAKTSGFLLPEKRYSSTCLKSSNISTLLALYTELQRKTKDTTMISMDGQRKQVILDSLLTCLKKKCLQPKKTISKQKCSANHIDLISIGRNMTHALNQLSYISQITHVLIENQISPIATRMKTIQGMLTQYFIMKCPSARIEYISASNKLKISSSFEHYLNEVSEMQRIGDMTQDGWYPQLDIVGQKNEVSESMDTEMLVSNNTYQQHKIDSIKYTEILLQHPTWCSWKTKFVHGKRDDLSDCFLQYIWWSNKQFTIGRIQEEK